MRAVQVGLYSLLFFPSIDKVSDSAIYIMRTFLSIVTACAIIFASQHILTDLIYLTLSIMNLALPVAWLIGYMYLSLRVSTRSIAFCLYRCSLKALSP